MSKRLRESACTPTGPRARSAFDAATTIRLQPAVRDAIRAIAAAEGNHESAVLRRVLAAGLRAVAGEQPAVSAGTR